MALYRLEILINSWQDDWDQNLWLLNVTLLNAGIKSKRYFAMTRVTKKYWGEIKRTGQIDLKLLRSLGKYGVKV